MNAEKAGQTSRGAEALADVYAKLDWASERHDDMQRVFADYAKPGGGVERPIGIEFHAANRPSGLIVARFLIEQPMPVRMSLLAADLVHNTRTALDQILARLKDHFGGDPRRGSFPTWQQEDDWQEHAANAGRRSPLRGLGQIAIDLVYAEQPLHRAQPEQDPLVILNKLDNTDKHQLLQPAFVYTEAAEGLDLIEILNPKGVQSAVSLWRAGQPLTDGTALARFLIRGAPDETVRARNDAAIGFGTGEVGDARTSYTGMIARVRDIADKAVALIDSKPTT